MLIGREHFYFKKRFENLDDRWLTSSRKSVDLKYTLYFFTAIFTARASRRQIAYIFLATFIFRHAYCMRYNFQLFFFYRNTFPTAMP